MKTQLITIGNSRGLRLPKAVIEACGFNGPITMDVAPGRLVLTPAHEPRQGWADSQAWAGPKLNTEDEDWLAFDDEPID